MRSTDWIKTKFEWNSGDYVNSLDVLIDDDDGDENVKGFLVWLSDFVLYGFVRLLGSEIGKAKNIS